MHAFSRSASAASLGAAVVLLAGAAPALAEGPATVTVRVEGFNGQTLLAQTQVTTNTTPVPVTGGSCSGTSAGGALYDAVGGNWQALSGSEGVEIDGIEGLNFPPFSAHGDAYWSFWLNNQFASQGACAEQLVSGDRVVFAAQCIAIGEDCPTSATAPDHFLTLTLTGTASSSGIADVGEPVLLSVGSISTATDQPEPALPPEVTLAGAPAGVALNAQGSTTISFSAPGTYVLQARAPDSVPSDPITLCVHNGNDGSCGTPLPTRPGAPGISPSAGTGAARPTPPYTGPYAVVARITGLLEHHVYSRRHAPRLLSGTVSAHTAVTSVSIALRRSYRGRCFAYSGVREQFAHARCGTAPFFEVSKDPSFSYLLPAALAPGRYVFDIEASDAAGNHTTLARGTSRIVFFVR